MQLKVCQQTTDNFFFFLPRYEPNTLERSSLRRVNGKHKRREQPKTTSHLNNIIRPSKLIVFRNDNGQSTIIESLFHLDIQQLEVREDEDNKKV